MPAGSPSISRHKARQADDRPQTRRGFAAYAAVTASSPLRFAPSRAHEVLGWSAPLDLEQCLALTFGPVSDPVRGNGGRPIGDRTRERDIAPPRVSPATTSGACQTGR
jgi:hypothetical protein